MRSPGPGAEAIRDRMFRALAVVRLVVLANAVVLNLYRAGSFERPLTGVLVVVGMAVWTALMLWAYASPARRTAPLLVADLAVAVAAMTASPLVKGADFKATVPGFWIVGAMLAWAICHRTLGGLAASAVLCVTDWAIRAEFTQTNYGHVFLLLIAGPIVGFLVGSLQRMAEERDRAERAAAVAQERARLARAVHDGVLQVLALVQRRGAELGGEAAELGRLAGEQERTLRHLIRSQDAMPEQSSGLVDLTARLGVLAARPGVSVAAPGGAVGLPAHVADELAAAVAACLDNVARHVGDDAPAWVLVESLPDRVEVTVRDNGPGIPTGRLEAAAASGRLGVAESIRGRVEDLGGTAEVTTGPSGTAWVLSVPTRR